MTSPTSGRPSRGVSRSVRLTDVPTTVVVASGKGGVGKTQISIDLAKALAAEGHTVGLLDADVSTPNAPEALAGEAFDFDGHPLSDGEHYLPVEADGVHVFSQGLELKDGVALLHGDDWKAEAMHIYVHTVDWPADTEYVIVDSPPGNGSEVQLVIAELEPEYGFLVTTGAAHSARDTRRTHELFVDAGVGHSVIANMRTAAFDLDYDAIRARVTDIHGIGEAKAADVIDAVRAIAGDGTVPLHDDGLDIEARVAAAVVADVPYTTDADRRQAALEAALGKLPQPAVVS